MANTGGTVGSPANMSGLRQQPWLPYENDRVGALGLYAPARWVQAFLPRRWACCTPLQYPVLRYPVRLAVGEILVYLLLLVLLGVTLGFLHERVPSGQATQIACLVVFLTAARNSPLTFVTGVPFERRLAVHKFAAYITLLLAVHHGVMHYWEVGDEKIAEINDTSILDKWDVFEVTGWVFFAPIALLCMTSLWFIRRWKYEVFYVLHVVLFTIAGLIAAAHGSGAVVAGFALWLIDIAIRRVYEARYAGHAATATFKTIPGDVVRITMAKGGVRYKGGQYITLAVKEMTMWQWHPFSISSSPDDDVITIHAKALGDYTERLYAYVAGLEAETGVAGGVELTVYFEEPQGEVEVDIESDRYRHVLCVAGGIGITPIRSLAGQLAAQAARGRPLSTLWCAWAAKDGIYKEFAGHLFGSALEGRGTLDAHEPFVGDQKALAPIGRVYLTGAAAEEYTEAPVPLKLPASTTIQLGRPDSLQVVRDFKAAVPPCEDGRVTRCAVLFCGPHAFLDDLRRACVAEAGDGYAFDIHWEEFEY